jgi:hypothetical protein
MHALQTPAGTIYHLPLVITLTLLRFPLAVTNHLIVMMVMLAQPTRVLDTSAKTRL